MAGDAYHGRRFAAELVWCPHQRRNPHAWKALVRDFLDRIPIALDLPFSYEVELVTGGDIVSPDRTEDAFLYLRPVFFPFRQRRKAWQLRNSGIDKGIHLRPACL